MMTTTGKRRTARVTAAQNWLNDKNDSEGMLT